ncbi:MAG: Mrp/NBP35 family ATP-binding protein [Candidatus Zixiibacteriota bacterium]
MIDKNEIMKILGTVEDPELRRPLTDLDMIKKVEIDGGKVEIEITLTIPGCPLKNKISKDVTSAVEQLEGVDSVAITFGAMTPEQKKNLAKKMYGKDHKKDSPEGEEANVAGDFAKRVIAVSSGKGGVGKSTVTSNLAAALAKQGYKVGVMDADVYGFSIPRILGVKGEPVQIDDHLVPLVAHGIQVMSIGFFASEDQPVIWRGPLLHKAVKQFISDVLWDQLDYLLIDLPPGTGDITLTIAQQLPKAEMLVVTTPQPVASHTAGRVAKLAEKTKLSVLGVIENMAYYENNGHRDYIFGKDGGKDLAKALGVPFLGEIPIKTEIREGADLGQPMAFSEYDDIAQYYLDITQHLIK